MFIVGISLSSDAEPDVAELGRSMGATRLLAKAEFYEHLIPAILNRG